MDGGPQLIISTHISSLAPSSQVTTVPLQTLRQNTPLPPPPKDSDPPSEHASYASVLHTSTTGSILLRVLHGGLILELLSLSTDIPPIRFVFPAAVLPSPAIFLWESHELHILAVTTTGSLYRLVLPASNGRQLWQDQIASNWCREYLIMNTPGSLQGLVQVQGTHCVAISLPNGSLLRLEAEILGDSDVQDEWAESVLQHSSFLSSLTAFLPTLNTSSTGSEIISMATHPWPTDIGHIWTLSRDRTLRLWKAKIGCVSARSLSSVPTPTPVPGTSASGSRLHILLEAEQQTLLRVFSRNSDEEHIYVLAFIPTPASSTSGGIFQLLDTVSDQLYEIGTIECSKDSAHCHLQDFVVSNTTLYTLWDRQGQSTIQKTVFNPTELSEQDASTPIWYTASYAQEPELTPAYLEELLLSPGSMTDKFFEAIMRPGMFSAFTLRTAIDQYTDACLSLPGPVVPQLTATYSTVGENIAAVVGCTVNLLRDPHTGALQHAKYWNALKRDWEGFIARCREVERSARWPLVLGVEEPQGEIIVVERERMGSLVNEDLPLTLHRCLISSLPLGPSYALLDILWTLRTKLGCQSMLSLETRLVDILHQEIAFSLADIIQDQAERSKFRDELDEGLESWIIGRLQSVDDIDREIRAALDIIGGFDMEIKREEDEVELLLPPSHSKWSVALMSTYAVASIQSRYELCLSLMTLPFFLSEELTEWDPSLLAEILAVFRSVAMFRFVSRQLGVSNDSKSSVQDSTTADDVIARLRNMQVSRNRTNLTPSYSLVHCLLAQSGDTHGLSGAAHRFLDGTGLLRSISPAHATKFEVTFCERFRHLGYYEVAREMLAWLPRTPGVTYVLGRLWLDVGRADDASSLMEKLAGSFSPENDLLDEDEAALAKVLPGGELFSDEFSFYLHASTLFKLRGLVQHEVHFCQLALSSAPSGTDTTTLWCNVIKGYTDLGLHQDAYASLIVTPYEKQKRECVSQLVYRMCEENAVEELITFNFVNFADEVEDALSFKARNVDPRVRPYYSRILYAWYVFRGDYRNAALVMYQRARKLFDLSSDPSTLLSLAEEQLEAYMVAINSLSLLDQKNAWIVMPVSTENGHEPRKRQKLSKHIPEDKYAPGKRDVEVVDLADIQYEYGLLSARLDLIRKDHTSLSAGEFFLSPSSIVLRLAQSNRFNTAMATAGSLKVDMTELFVLLTSQCLRLSRNPDAVMQGDTSDWLLTDRVSSWSGTPADRGWRYLRQSLERYDGPLTDYHYTKVTLEAVLESDRSPPPPWLIHSLEEHHHEYLIRIGLRYGVLEFAAESALSLLRKTEARLARDPPKTASSTWLPYTLLDQLLVSAAAQNELSPRGQALIKELQAELSQRVKRMQKLSQFQR